MVLVNVNQSFNEISLQNDEQNSSRSTNRSKTGNKNAFKIASTQLDVTNALSNDETDIKTENYQKSEAGLLVSPCVKMQIPNSNINSVINVHSLHSNVSTISLSPINPLTTSKSENNIFDKNMSMNTSPFNFVVSLSDLSDDNTQYCNADSEIHYMNDLSRTQVLNCLSEEQIDGKIINRF